MPSRPPRRSRATARAGERASRPDDRASRAVRAPARLRVAARTVRLAHGDESRGEHRDSVLFAVRDSEARGGKADRGCISGVFVARGAARGARELSPPGARGGGGRAVLATRWRGDSRAHGGDRRARALREAACRGTWRDRAHGTRRQLGDRRCGDGGERHPDRCRRAAHGQSDLRRVSLGDAAAASA